PPATDVGGEPCTSAAPPTPSSQARPKASPGKAISSTPATATKPKVKAKPKPKIKAISTSPIVGPVPGGISGSSIYCVCHSSDEGFMVECSDGTGGCGGWFHPECCNLELSAEQRQKSEC
ncbi:unnamed protein product, partial [Laminaria digitata]